MSSHTARWRAAAVAAAVVLGVTACAPGEPLPEVVAEQLPTLDDRGFDAVPCTDSEVFGAVFEESEDDEHVAQCWHGDASQPFYDEANDLVDEAVVNTGGTDITADVCPADVLNEAGGVACRAVLVERGGDEVLIRMVVVLRDVGSVLEQLSEQPTQDELNAALTGAPVGVLIATEPTVAP